MFFLLLCAGSLPKSKVTKNFKNNQTTTHLANLANKQPQTKSLFCWHNKLLVCGCLLPRLAKCVIVWLCENSFRSLFCWHKKPFIDDFVFGFAKLKKRIKGKNKNESHVKSK